jgi:probable phosphoglycerate mutase
MRLIFVRHGETKWKKIGFLSYTDLELTKNGLQQAKKVTLRLKKENIDRVYSSPLKRCKQTAEVIGKYLKSKAIIAPSFIPSYFFNNFRKKRKEN